MILFSSNSASCFGPDYYFLGKLTEGNQNHRDGYHKGKFDEVFIKFLQKNIKYLNPLIGKFLLVLKLAEQSSNKKNLIRVNVKMNNHKTQRILDKRENDNFEFLAWRKVAECYGILFDESTLKRIAGCTEEDVLNALLNSTNIIFSEDDKWRVIHDRRHYYSEYIGAY